METLNNNKCNCKNCNSMSKKDSNWGWGLAAGLAALVGGAWLISEIVNSNNDDELPKDKKKWVYKCNNCGQTGIKYGTKQCPNCKANFKWEV